MVPLLIPAKAPTKTLYSVVWLLKFFIDGNALATDQVLFLLIGCVVAFGVSMLVIKLLMSFIKKHDFKVFGYYRIVLGIIVLIYFAVAG